MTEHERDIDWAIDASVALAALATFETYSVLTRLPGALRVAPAMARQVIRVTAG